VKNITWSSNNRGEQKQRRRQQAVAREESRVEGSERREGFELRWAAGERVIATKSRREREKI